MTPAEAGHQDPDDPTVEELKPDDIRAEATVRQTEHISTINGPHRAHRFKQLGSLVGATATSVLPRPTTISGPNATSAACPRPPRHIGLHEQFSDWRGPQRFPAPDEGEARLEILESGGQPPGVLCVQVRTGGDVRKEHRPDGAGPVVAGSQPGGFGLPPTSSARAPLPITTACRRGRRRRCWGRASRSRARRSHTAATRASSRATGPRRRGTRSARLGDRPSARVILATGSRASSLEAGGGNLAAQLSRPPR